MSATATNPATATIEVDGQTIQAQAGEMLIAATDRAITLSWSMSVTATTA